MATEEVTKDSTTSKRRNDLETLSLNYLRSQNISQIPDDNHIPKLPPCKLCNKAMFGFQFEALTILCCGHLLHRLCVETYIMRGGVRSPSCPICNWDIEINREELGLASGECFLPPRLLAEKGGKASQQSNKTIDDDEGELEIMRNMGLIEEDFVTAEKTKQVNTEDRGTSPIAGEIINNNQNEKGATNSVQANQPNEIDTPHTSQRSSPRITREQERFQGLLRELSTPVKGESTKNGNEEEEEISDGSLSKNLARLYQKALRAEKRVSQAYQEEIRCWYQYAEQFEKSVKEITDNNREIGDKTARGQVYDTIMSHLTGITKENLRKKTQKARAIFTLFSKIGLQKIKRVQSYSADSISKLTGDQIKSIIEDLNNASFEV